MKKIITICSLCALTFVGVATAQEASSSDAKIKVDLTGNAPAKEASPEAKKAADDMVAFMKEMMAVCTPVKDKASADAAAVKIKELYVRFGHLKDTHGIPREEIDAAMNAKGPEVFGIIMGLGMTMDKIQKADFYGSAALKEVVEAVK